MTRKQILSYLILLLWLALRISQSALVVIHDDILAISSNSDPLSNWIVVLYGLILFGSFPLITVVIALNRDELQKLNIDKLYVILLLMAGILAFYELPFNCLNVVAFIYVLYAWLSKKVKFGSPDPVALRVGLWGVGIFISIFLLIIGLLDMPKIVQNVRYFIFELTPGSIFEEAMYRGLLFMFLKDLKLRESKFLCTQALLFWISHINYVFQGPLYFWIFIPAMGLTLGYIALRTKSIAVSAITHILMNVISVALSLSVGAL